jgi:hypothetical protein
MSKEPNLARLAGRVGAYAQHAAHDVRETTRAARAAFLTGFERAVDPEGILAPGERARRAEAARKAHFTKLALRSVQARALRRKAASLTAQAKALDAEATGASGVHEIAATEVHTAAAMVEDGGASASPAA